MIWLCIDPGITGTGFAVFQDKNPEPIYVHDENKKAEWDVQIAILARELDRIVTVWQVMKVYCEYPEWQESGKGAAAAIKGDIFKLSSVVGAFMGVCAIRNIRFIPVNVSWWKGQVSKSNVVKRIRGILPESDWTYSEARHYTDAVGIGLYVLGLLHKPNRKFLKD